MKRIAAICLALGAALLLSGCEGNMFSSHRDMEHLRPIQTIGLDRTEGGVILSVSSGIGPDGGAPLVMKTSAAGIEPAISRLQDYSPEDELFYAHVRYILIGETMADQGVMPLLDWAERSPAMRMDTVMLAVKGNAYAAVTGASGAKTDITERLASLEREELVRGLHVYTLREAASSLLERGSALCMAVEQRPSEGTVYTEEEVTDAVIPAGYAVLQNGALAAYLTEEETLGAALLEKGVTGTHIKLDGCVLELFGASASASGVWEEGRLSGIRIDCTLQAGVLERKEGGAEDVERLQSALSAAVESALSSAVSLSQRLGCDYLDLRGAVMKTAPTGAADADGDWETMFPSLPVTVKAAGEIQRSYDLSN